MIKGQQYMTQQQKALVQGFEADMEAEYALCIEEMRKANQAIELTATDLSEQHQNLVSSEIDALRKYWHNRLEALVNLLSRREHNLLQELNKKYPRSLKQDYE